MADDTTTDLVSQTIATALAGLISAPPDSATEQARALLMARLANVGGVLPSRIPAPLNITEVGGYLNLLEAAGEPESRLQAIAAALGIAGPIPAQVVFGAAPLFFASRANPVDTATAAAPLAYRVRSDVVAAFDTAMQSVRDRGGDLTWLDLVPLQLPPATSGAALPTDLLVFVGRRLRLVPGNTLRDGTTDTYSVAAPATSGTTPRPVARVTDPLPTLATVAADWDVTTATSSTTTVTTLVAQSLFELDPLFAPAGWVPVTPATPVTNNVAIGTALDYVLPGGLVVGVTTFGEELRKFWTEAEVASSSLRDATGFLWNGTTFA